MVSYTYAQNRPPTREEVERWNRELQLFHYQPPDPNALSAEKRRGWGFEDYLAPPPDCYDYVVANYKRLKNRKLSDPLEPAERYCLLTTLATYFAWLRTPEGTRWLVALHGIRMPPPHPGFAYFYKTERLVEPEYGLRIYDIDSSQRATSPPHEYYGPELIEKLQRVLAFRRAPARTSFTPPVDGMWRWVGDFLRNWFMEPKADVNWPTHKPDRISGYTWARGLLRPGSQTDYVWNVIGLSEVYTGGRLYRIQRPAYEERVVGGVVKRVQPAQPGIWWTDRKDMRTVPLDDLDQHLGVAPATTEARYRCRSCGQMRCCTTEAQKDRLCMNCRGTQLESGERPSLRWCQYRECRNCPEHLRNTEDLINLVSRLNTSSDRVRRPY